MIFILYGDVGSIVDIVKRLKDAGKTAVVHMELINGLRSGEAALDYIRNYTEADGIITTKHSLIPHAKALGLNTILRMFLLDSTSLDTFERNSAATSVSPDVMEVLPGALLPELIARIVKTSKQPVMCSGMITTKSEVLNALDNGAVSISTTNEKLWRI